MNLNIFFKSYKYMHASDMYFGNNRKMTSFHYYNPFLDFYLVGDDTTPSKFERINHTNEKSTFSFDVGKHTHLLIRNFCYTVNSRHETCTHVVGTCILPLGNMIKGENTCVIQDFCLPNNNQLAKVIFNADYPENTQFQTSSSAAIYDDNIQNLFDKYINLSLQHYDHFSNIGIPSTKNKLARIHSPYLQLQSNNVVLPSSLYTLPQPALRTTQDILECKNFYTNLFNIVLENNDMSREEFMYHGDAFLQNKNHDKHIVLYRMLGELVSILPNTQPYIHDFYRKYNCLNRGSEATNDRYSLSLKNGGDCEDFAKLSHTMYNDIQRLFTCDYDNKVMNMLASLYDFYVPIINQGAVSNASFSLIESCNILNHVFFILYPRKKLSSKLGLLEQMQKNKVQFQPIEDTMPLLLCEGTGMTQVIATDLEYGTHFHNELSDYMQAKNSLESMYPELCNLKTTCMEKSNFYKYCISGFTDYYYNQGFSFLEICYLNEHENTYGVAFEDVMNFGGNIIPSYMIDGRDQLVEKGKLFLNLEAPIEPHLLQKDKLKCNTTTKVVSENKKHFFPKLVYMTQNYPITPNKNQMILFNNLKTVKNCSVDTIHITNDLNITKVSFQL